MPGFAAVHVEGLRDLNRAFGKLSKELKAGLRDELAKAAEPVRAAAEQHAVNNISNIGPLWKQMRIGITTSLVYVAPKMRRRRGSPRTNLAPMLVDAMEQGLDDEQEQIVDLVDAMLGRMAGDF